MKYDGFLPKRLRSVSVLDSLFWTLLIMGSGLVFLADEIVLKHVASWLVIVGIFGLLGAAFARLANYLASNASASGAVVFKRSLKSQVWANRGRSGSTILAALIVAMAIISPSFQETAQELVRPLTDMFRMAFRER